MLQDKHMIYIYLQGEYPHDLGGTSICQVKEYLEKLYEYVNMLFKDNLPRDLHIAFEITMFLIMKGNLNLIHNTSKIHINIYITYQEKENWIYYTMKCNIRSF